MLKYAAYAGKAAGRSGRYRWHTLEAAARQLGVNPGGHRALGDAEACRLVVQRMAAATIPAL
jgi:DNA polymerase III epsilon subunit-like protein